MIEELRYLNSEIKKDLLANNFEPKIIGNLFYAHYASLEEQLCDTLFEGMEIKRKRFVSALENKKSMFEIGINGGHSALLTLISNPNIVVYANDIAQPFKDYHPEIYVLTACRVLKELFGERFNYIIGNCLHEVPMFIKKYPNIQFDIIHIDGGKNTYYKDFYNLYPSLLEDATIIFDDTQDKQVKAQVDQLIKEQRIKIDPEFPRLDIRYNHEVTRKI